MAGNYKLVGLWSSPPESMVDEFEAHYREVHVPLAKAVPGLRSIALTRASGDFAGAEAAFYRLAEMFFDSPEAMAESASSDEWHAMHADGQKLIERFGITLRAGAGWQE